VLWLLLPLPLWLLLALRVSPVLLLVVPQSLLLLVSLLGLGLLLSCSWLPGRWSGHLILGDASLLLVLLPAGVDAARVAGAAGCWLLAAGCWLLVLLAAGAAGCWLLVLLAAGCWCCWLLAAAGCWLLAAGCWLLVLLFQAASCSSRTGRPRHSSPANAQMRAGGGVVWVTAVELTLGLSPGDKGEVKWEGRGSVGLSGARRG